MNPEINRKFIEIRDKCSKAHPEKYPDYCWRAILDILDLLNLLAAEIADKENAIEDLALLDGFVKMEDLLS